MQPVVLKNTYGKARVRFVKVKRKSKTHHDYKQINVRVLIEGDFDTSYTHGDNSKVIPTDTCKNIIYVVARDPIDTIEKFGVDVAQVFLREYTHVSNVNLKIEEDIWERMVVDGTPHPHSFVKQPHLRTAKISASRSGITIESGIKNITILKTTQSGFSDFHKCKYTSLQDVQDRLLGTNVKASWVYTNYVSRNGYRNINFDDIWHKVLACIFEAFALEYSVSVQQTVYSACTKAIQRIEEIESITFSLPNIHNFFVDYSKLKLPPSDNVYICMDEPHGLIKATIGRKDVKPRL